MNPVEATRTFTRVPVHISAHVHTPDGRTVLGRVHDISLGGVSIETDDRIALDARCSVELLLHAGDARLEISLVGHVVRQGEGFVAFATDAIDPDGYEHLLKLLLYNAPDAHRFEEEVEVRADLQPPLARS